MKPAQDVAQEIAEAMRRRFGTDIRQPDKVRWLALCIETIRAEDCGMTPAAYRASRLASTE